MTDLALASDLSRTDHLEGSYRIAYRKNYNVFVGDLSASKPKRIFAERNRGLSCPMAWSNDGTTVYVSHRQIYAINVDTGAQRPVTDFDCDDEFSAIWLLKTDTANSSLVFLQQPDLFRMKFLLLRTMARQLYAKESPRYTLDPMHLCAVEVGTGRTRKLFDDPAVWRIMRADAQPASHRCVLLLSGKDGQDLWSVNMDGSGSAYIARMALFVTDIVLSPNGEFVAFTHDGGLSVIRIADRVIRHISDAPNFCGRCVAWWPLT